MLTCKPKAQTLWNISIFAVNGASFPDNLVSTLWAHWPKESPHITADMTQWSQGNAVHTITVNPNYITAEIKVWHIGTLKRKVTGVNAQNKLFLEWKSREMRVAEAAGWRKAGRKDRKQTSWGEVLVSSAVSVLRNMFSSCDRRTGYLWVTFNRNSPGAAFFNNMFHNQAGVHGSSRLAQAPSFPRDF